jgi:lipopolysaccharide heptosyltransferase III
MSPRSYKKKFLRLSPMYRKRPSVPQRNRILIYRIGSLGDTLVALPCFHLIARTFAGSERILLTNVPIHAKAPAAASVLGKSGLIDDYLTYSVGARNISNLAKLWWKIRSLRISTLIYLAPPRGESVARRDKKFFRLCGVKKIIGIPLGGLANHDYDSVTGRYESEASRLARCLAPLGDACLNDPTSWSLLLTQEERARAASALRPLGGARFLVFGIASKMQATDWGIANWKALMPKLHREFPEQTAVFIGAKEDHQAIASVAVHWPGRSLNLSGDLTPRESAAVIQKADMFFGLDSGPMHLAASVGTACVAIFSARNRPGIWFPFGSAHTAIYHQTECFGCGLESCTVENKKCILSISVDEVVTAAKRARDRGLSMPLAPMSLACPDVYMLSRQPANQHE